MKLSRATSNPALFRKTYARLYFDSKQLEQGLKRGGGEFFGTLLSKKVLFFH